MTREEAIKIIDCYDIGFYDLSGEKIPADKLADAFDMAIEALTAMESCVLTQFGECSYNETGCSDCEIKEKIRKALEQSQWIPCDKKLPNEDEMYYNGVGIDGVRKVSDRVLAIDSKGFIRCGYFMSSMWDHPYHGAGRIVNCYTDPLKACWEFGDHYKQDPENWIVGGKGDIVAWMPLPEPYKGGEQDEHQ